MKPVFVLKHIVCLLRLKMASFVVLDLALLVYLVDLVVAAVCAQPGLRVAPCEYCRVL